MVERRIVDNSASKPRPDEVSNPRSVAVPTRSDGAGPFTHHARMSAPQSERLTSSFRLVAADTGQHEQSDVHDVLAGDVPRPEGQLAAPLRQTDATELHRSEVPHVRLPAGDAVVLAATHWRIVGFGHQSPHGIAAERELDVRPDVTRRTGVVNLDVVLPHALDVDFDVPGDLVLDARPVAEVRTVGEPVGSLDSTVRLAVPRRQLGV